MRVSLIILTLLGGAYGNLAYADKCRSGVGFSIEEDFAKVGVGPGNRTIEVQGGFGEIIRTGSPQDFEGETLCENLGTHTINLGTYGKLSAIRFEAKGEIQGPSSYILVEANGSAAVDGSISPFNQSIDMRGQVDFRSFDGEIGSSFQRNTVCGERIDLSLSRFRAYMSTNPNENNFVRVRVTKVVFVFQETQRGDPSCINNPLAIAPTLDLPFGENTEVALRSSSTQKCVDVSDFANWPGAPIQQWDCAHSPNQRFRVKRIGQNFKLQATHSNQCLWIGNGVNANGTITTQGDCNSPAALINIGPTVHNIRANTFVLRSTTTGKCLDIDSGRPDNGVKLQQWDCVGTPWQEWQIYPI